MTRWAALKLIAAGLILGVAVWLWFKPRVIDEAQADSIAKAAAVRFVSSSGEPVVHFGKARRLAWPDGWEFVWSYRPCPDDSALRIFVPMSGRGVRITEEPDCSGDHGLGVRPIRV